MFSMPEVFVYEYGTLEPSDETVKRPSNMSSFNAKDVYDTASNSFQQAKETFSEATSVFKW
jgi:hypothetical protein